MWLLSAIFAYFFFAVSVFIDRFLLAGPLKNPHLYAFYIGILSGLGVLLVPAGLFLPLGIAVPPLEHILLGLLAGFYTIFALLAWFVFVSKEEVSRAAPAVGALQPIFVLLLILLLAGSEAQFAPADIFAFVFFVAGSAGIMMEKFSLRLRISNWQLSLVSAFLFALSIVFMKFIFLVQPFFTSVVLFGSGSAIAALSLLAFSQTRQGLRQPEKLDRKVLIPFLIDRVAGALGTGGLLLAIFLAKVSQVPMVNAMSGFQFLFLYILVYLFSKRYPQVLQEKMTGKILLQKFGALIVIAVGFLFLAFG